MRQKINLVALRADGLTHAFFYGQGPGQLRRLYLELQRQADDPASELGQSEADMLRALARERFLRKQAGGRHVGQ